MRAGHATASSLEPKRILVRAPNWLGDVVMSTPGIHALRRAHPDAHIVGLVPETLAPLLSGSSDLDEIWTLGARGLTSMRAVAQRIAAQRFDLGLAIPESISSALMMRWGRVHHVVGFARDALRRTLLHQVVPAPVEWGRRRLVSKEEFVLRLVQAVGAQGLDTRLRLEVTAEERSRLAGIVSSRGVDPGLFATRPPIVLAPGASFGDSKCWPVTYYAGLADAMASRGECVVLVGSEAERERSRAVRNAMKSSPVDLTGALDLGTLKSIFAHAKLLVANDAGARHVAAAFGVPSVIFFGPTSVAKTDRNLERIEVLETEHGCRPCYRRSCPIDHRCLASISVSEAIAAADRALRSAPRHALATASRVVTGGGAA